MIPNKSVCGILLQNKLLQKCSLIKVGAAFCYRIRSFWNNPSFFSFTEYALAEMIPKYPHLVKLGVRLEFRQGENIDFHTSFDKFKNVKNLGAIF